MWRVMMRKFLLATLLILAMTCSVVFASVDNLKFDGFIADEAGLFKPASIKNMNAQFYDIQKKKNVTVAVVTLKNTGGKDLESLGNKILEDYKIGNQNRGDGILFLLTDEEKLKTEELVNKWNQAKKEKNFELADELRAKIQEKNIVL